MTSQAAKELLDVIMLDDFVARKRALDVWGQRWVATVVLEHPVPHREWKAFELVHRNASKISKTALLYKLLEGMERENDTTCALEWSRDADEQNVINRVVLRVLLAKPKEGV